MLITPAEISAGVFWDNLLHMSLLCGNFGLSLCSKDQKSNNFNLDK